MADMFAAKLEDRLRLGCPVTGIEHGESGVRVRYRGFGDEKKIEADYLVCCMSLENCRGGQDFTGTPAGGATASALAEEAVMAFRRYYPGKSEDIEQALVVDWCRDPWAMACERIYYSEIEVFVGHMAVALGAKVRSPCSSLGLFVAAAFALDLLWPVFLLLGIERVRIDPGDTKFTPLETQETRG